MKRYIKTNFETRSECDSIASQVEDFLKISDIDYSEVTCETDEFDTDVYVIMNNGTYRYTRLVNICEQLEAQFHPDICELSDSQDGNEYFYLHWD